MMLPLTYLYKALQLNEESLQTILLCVKLRLQKITIFGKEEITFFKSYLFLLCYQVSNVNHRISGLERAFCPPKLSHSPDNFFITISRFSTTVLFWQNATLSNIWIGIAFFAIRNTFIQ